MTHITVPEAAKLLEVSVKTIYNYINADLLTLYKIKRNKSVLLKTQVLNLLEPTEASRNLSSSLKARDMISKVTE